MPVVLISRGTMTGSRKCARCLAKKLGVRSVSREDLVALVDRHGPYAKQVLEALGNAPRAYDQFSQLRRPYLILMRLALLELILEGDIVYQGYSGHLLIPDMPCCLKVRIDAPLDLRVQNAMERLGLPEDQAREAIRREDEERVRWARFMYGRDIRDPKLYDVCFSLGWLSTDTVSTMITSACTAPELQPTEETQRALHELYLSSRVEAELITHPETIPAGTEIGARAKDGNVLLEGPYLGPDTVEAVLSIARSVPGVKAVDYQPGYATGLELRSLV